MTCPPPAVKIAASFTSTSTSLLFSWVSSAFRPLGGEVGHDRLHHRAVGVPLHLLTRGVAARGVAAGQHQGMATLGRPSGEQRPEPLRAAATTSSSWGAPTCAGHSITPTSTW
jgi:hypothetical protein